MQGPLRLPITTTEGHQGKMLEVDYEQETVTLLSPEGTPLGTVSWESLIAFIRLTGAEDAYLNHRTYPRAPLAVKVRYTTGDGKQFESLTGGLGGGGLFIENSSPLAPGSELDLEFALPDRPYQRLHAKAKVAWVRTKAERYLLFPGMGVQFVDIDSEARRRVEELVEALTRTRQGA